MPYVKRTPLQSSEISKWLRKSVSRRTETQSDLAKRIGMSKSALSRAIAARRSRTDTHKHRVSDNKIASTYKKLRDQRAHVGDYEKVTSEEVSDELSFRRGSKFRSRSRCRAAIVGKARVRDPTKAPNGALARKMKLKADLKHHCRI